MVRKWLAIGFVFGGILVGMGLIPLGSAAPFAGEANAETRRQERHERREARRLERRLRHERRHVARIQHREQRQLRHLHRLLRR